MLKFLKNPLVNKQMERIMIIQAKDLCYQFPAELLYKAISNHSASHFMKKKRKPQ